MHGCNHVTCKRLENKTRRFPVADERIFLTVSPVYGKGAPGLADGHDLHIIDIYMWRQTGNPENYIGNILGSQGPGTLINCCGTFSIPIKSYRRKLCFSHTRIGVPSRSARRFFEKCLTNAFVAP